MTKMPKMQKIPNLLLFVSRDHQLVYFTMFSPYIKCSLTFFEHSVYTKLLEENATIILTNWVDQISPNFGQSK
jgi:hypothetical protein